MSKTTVTRTSDRELVVTRRFKAPVARVFEAWTRAEQFQRWWMPKSCGMVFLSCEIDARTGGGYRFTFSHPASPQPMTFFGKYLEVTPPSHLPGRLVWTNDEGGAPGPVTTATFEQHGNETLFVLHDLYPSKEALDAAVASHATSGFGEQFEQLDALLAG